ncbi:SecDF P1 head subdomain-containing protein [Microbacterium sp. MMO-10]|uniref:SecDF P1 head subdomain-containing protein n=1 Tax=Microbacterium sp. MMO-10 TaxID=3081272 RepID=UPI00301A3067
MSRSIRSGVLAFVLAAGVLVLAGCTGLPFSAPALTHEVVLRVPAGKADTVARQLGHRLDVAGISERSIGTDGDRVAVRYTPPKTGGAEVEVREDLFQAPGEFAIRPVTAVGEDAAGSGDCTQAAERCTAMTEEQEVLRLGPVGVGDKDLDTVKAVDVQNQWGVQVDFTESGADAFAALSGKAACEEDPALKRMAILLDGKLLTAPSVQLECGQSLSTSVQISGGFDRTKAEQYAALMGAPLPDGVQIVSSKP